MTQYRQTHRGNMTPEEVAEIYAAMKQDGVAKVVFYDGGVRSWQDWMQFTWHSKCWVVRSEHPVLGMTGAWWLNGFHARTAMIHFATLKGRGLPEKIEEGRQSMQWLADMGVLSSVYGLTPKVYKNVWPYMDGLGFERVGVLPGACFMAYHGRCVDGVISVLDLAKYKRG